MAVDGIGLEGAKTVSEVLKVNTTLKRVGLDGKKSKEEDSQKKEKMSVIYREWDWS